METAQLTPGPLAGQPLALLQAGVSLLRHADGRTGTFAHLEPDGRMRVQSLKGRGFWVFDPAHCDYDGPRQPPPEKPNKRKLAKARTRQIVLAAARELFESVGYARASIRDIARAAGMSTGAVFANVADKDALWTAAIGGPAPDLATADEIARTLAALPDHSWALSFNAGAYRVTIATPDFDPLKQVGRCFGGKGPSPAAALRMARAAATHAVRQETVQ